VTEKLGLKNVPSYLNGPAGGLMGAVKGALFISVLLIPLNYFPSMKKEFMEKSYVAQLVSGVSELCYPLFRFDASKTEQIIKDDINKLKPANKPAAKPMAEPVEKQQASPPKVAEHAPAQVSARNEKEPAVASAKPAASPVVKKAAPVKKQKQGAEEGDMDNFVKSLR
jgi:hypothetical protein